MPDIKQLTNLNIPELEIYTRLNEVQLKRFYEPHPGLFICESPKVIRRAMDAGYEPESFLCEPRYLEGEDRDLLVRFPEVPVYTAPLEILTKLTGFHLTNGMLCAMKRRPPLSAEELLKGTAAARVAILEDIENPTNIGAIFRSAAAMMIDAVLLTEGCSDPLYRRAARVSMGNVFLIPWTYLPREESADNAPHYIDLLHELGYKTAALALSDHSVSIDDPVLKKEEKLAIILGNEGNGLPEETVRKSDYVVKIPMAEGVDSLNVAAASAVAFWELRR